MIPIHDRPPTAQPTGPWLDHSGADTGRVDEVVSHLRGVIPFTVLSVILNVM